MSSQVDQSSARSIPWISSVLKDTVIIIYFYFCVSVMYFIFPFRLYVLVKLLFTVNSDWGVCPSFYS